MGSEPSKDHPSQGDKPPRFVQDDRNGGWESVSLSNPVSNNSVHFVDGEVEGRAGHPEPVCEPHQAMTREAAYFFILELGDKGWRAAVKGPETRAGLGWEDRFL